MMRQTTVAGEFYPNSKKELAEMFEPWSISIPDIPDDFIPKAAIVPHAGYVYSGRTAFHALSLLDLSTFKRAVIIGPSHRWQFNGVSISPAETFCCPSGNMRMDTEFAEQLINRYNLHYEKYAHTEHSTEVQIPLIQYLEPEINIVEAVYGIHAERELKSVIDHILDTRDTALIISSDLSHYHPEDVAHRLDKNIVEAVDTLNPEKLSRGEACGMAGIRAVIQSVKDKNGESVIIEYTTSAKAGECNREHVVGYLSALFSIPRQAG